MWEGGFLNVQQMENDQEETSELRRKPVSNWPKKSLTGDKPEWPDITCVGWKKNHNLKIELCFYLRDKMEDLTLEDTLCMSSAGLL